MSFPLVVATSGASGATYIGTVWGEEAMNHERVWAQKSGVSLFPVMEMGQMLGVISATEMIKLVAHSQGVWKNHKDLNQTPINLGFGVLGKLADVTEVRGAKLEVIYPLGQNQRQAEDDSSERPVIFRFHTEAVWGGVNTREATGIPDSDTIRISSLSRAERHRVERSLPCFQISNQVV